APRTGRTRVVHTGTSCSESSSKVIILERSVAQPALPRPHLVVVGAGASDCDALEVDCSNGRRSFDAADGWTGGTELADEVDRGTIAQTATAPTTSAAIAVVASCHLVSAGL